MGAHLGSQNLEKGTDLKTKKRGQISKLRKMTLNNKENKRNHIPKREDI